MATSWPGNLPAYFSKEGFNESTPDNLLRTEMDVGPPKVRRRQTAAPYQINTQIVMTTAQLADFRTFYMVTLKSGSLPFTKAHPRSGASTDFRFVSPPSWIPHGVDWTVSIVLEVLP